MTLGEAIKHYEEVADKFEKENVCGEYTLVEQIIDKWLKELSDRKNQEWYFALKYCDKE